jgi:hypothetical protein
MWESAALDLDQGTWTKRGSGKTLDDCRAVSASSKEKLFDFWGGEVPADEAAILDLYKKVSEANDGNISRLTIGLELGDAKRAPGISSCPGRCFCVVAHGRRRCETYWCSATGLCWWVPCGMGC